MLWQAIHVSLKKRTQVCGGLNGFVKKCTPWEAKKRKRCSGNRV
eukprot:jgi/Antlo1/902/1733